MKTTIVAFWVAIVVLAVAIAIAEGFVWGVAVIVIYGVLSMIVTPSARGNCAAQGPEAGRRRPNVPVNSPVGAGR